MYKELYTKIKNTIKAEANYIDKSENDTLSKLKKMNDLINVSKVIENFDELEPLFIKFFNEKARKKKFEEER